MPWRSCASLRSLNITGSKGWTTFSSTEASMCIINITEWCPFWAKYYQNVVNLILDDLLKPKEIPPLKYMFVGELNFTLDLETIYLRKNSLQYVNIEVHTNLFKHVKLVDLSENIIEYINPTFLGNSAITDVSLANNKRSKMAENSPYEFKNLLVYMNNLETIDLSTNGLSSIPADWFKSNTKLKRKVLRDNKLSGFARTEHILPEYIDLTYNLIQSFDLGTIEWFNNVSKMRENGTFIVNLAENPLQCTCDTFVQWLIDSDFIDKNPPLKCFKKGTAVNITSKMVETLEQECKQESSVWLYIIGSVCSVMLIASFAPLTKLCRFTHRQL